jgi:vitamin K-dependent gamma-carboxylase
MWVGALDKTTSQILLEKPSRVWQNVQQRLFAPTSIRVLVYFRVVFGALMLWQVWRYFNYNWIERYYIEPKFYFAYYGFDWLRPWPGDGTVLHFYGMAVLAICIMLGLFYRLSMGAFFLAFAYVFLLDQTNYLNHYYLVCLISFLLIFVPAHRAFSVDAWWRPRLRADSAPTWTLWMLRFQLALVYGYAGVAKLNRDWLNGRPVQMWLADRTDFPIIGRYFTEQWMAYLFSYGGLLFDLTIIPLILWRTRLLAIGLI